MAPMRRIISSSARQAVAAPADITDTHAMYLAADRVDIEATPSGDGAVLPVAASAALPAQENLTVLTVSPSDRLYPKG